MTELKLFVCERGEQGWEGALLIFAESKEEATKIFKEYENIPKECWEDKEYQPFKVSELEVKKGVIYDDYKR